MLNPDELQAGSSTLLVERVDMKLKPVMEQQDAAQQPGLTSTIVAVVDPADSGIVSLKSLREEAKKKEGRVRQPAAPRADETLLVQAASNVRRLGGAAISRPRL